MRDNQLVVVCEGCQRLGSYRHVAALVLGRQRLTALQKGIASKRHYDPHESVAGA